MGGCKGSRVRKKREIKTGSGSGLESGLKQRYCKKFKVGK